MDFEMENDPGWRYLRLSREQLTKEQSAPFDSKKDMWIPDKDEGFVAVKVVSAKGDQIVVSNGEKEVTVKKDVVQPMNPPKFEKAEDMSNLTILNDASVLQNLRARYQEMLIYTYSGLFCVVINPYKRLPIYTNSVASMYMGKRRTEMPPHLFAVADEAYRNMLQDHENQSMLITGESGAGKTENTKKVIAYFASVGASQIGESQTDSGGKKVTLEDQIVQTNPVLEAFGNARTVRNNNSSRFGKFIRIHFSKAGKVASCDIEHYLLEKSRVIRQAPGERCYHIFYQMFSDYKPELKPFLLLDRPLRDYWFVAQAELTVDGMNDAEEFQLTDEAFDILHFTEEEKLNCYRLMSAHMHLGIVKFKQRPREEQAEPDGTDEAQKAAKMYGVDCDVLLKAFTHPRVKVGTEWVSKGQNVNQVNWAVGATCKAIYARVFSWLVKKCNITLDQKGTPRDFFIGVLDIAGFEIFDLNSFEQLWINFVNEKLQQFFNHHMFVLEQEEYAREHIDWTFIDFGLDLQACIELIEKPMGIISMLDEECIVPKASDITLGQKLNEQHLGKHPNFEKPRPPKGKQAEAHFAMRHYAGIVRYNVTNWLEKNKDPLNDTVATCLKASPDNALLNEIWADYVTQEEAMQAGRAGQVKKKGKSGSFMTVSMLYRESLNNLMGMLYKTHPHFIRCIIPNEKKTAGLLDATLVLNQLTCNGVLEGIRICRKGFPNRTLHSDFIQRYAILATEEAKGVQTDSKAGAIKMLERLVQDKCVNNEMFRVGLTKVFFKAGVLAHLEDARDEKLNYVLSGFQAHIRSYFQKIDVADRRCKVQSTVVIQNNLRWYTKMLTWNWFQLYMGVMPIVRESKVEEIFEKLKVEVEQYEQMLNDRRDQHEALSDRITKVSIEKKALLDEVSSSHSSSLELENEIQKLSEENAQLEKALEAANEKIHEEDGHTASALAVSRKLKADAEALQKNKQELELSKRKSEAEKLAFENQLKTLREEIRLQYDAISKASLEVRHHNEVATNLDDNIKSQLNRIAQDKKVNEKLAQVLKENEERLFEEKRVRENADKARRQADGSLKIAQETLDELEKRRQDLANGLKKRRNKAYDVETRIEQAESSCSVQLKQMKQEQKHVEELEQAIESERNARSSTDRSAGELKFELDEIDGRLREQRLATGVQLEAAKRCQADISNLRFELENAKSVFDSVLSDARKKNMDAVADLNEQMQKVRSANLNAENEKNSLQRQLELELSRADADAKSKAELERNLNASRFALQELKAKDDVQERNVVELRAQQQRALDERHRVGQELLEVNKQVDNWTHIKSQQTAEIEQYEQLINEQLELVRTANSNSNNLQRELERLKELLSDEDEEVSELNRLIRKADVELHQLNETLESRGMIPGEVLDETKRRQATRLADLQDSLDTASTRLAHLDKIKLQLSAEADEAAKEVERHANTLTQMEKKQKSSEAEVAESQRKINDLSNELETVQLESRRISIEVHNELTKNDQLAVKVDALKHTNASFVAECDNGRTQLQLKNQTVSELEKTVGRMEVERSELHAMLDEAEAAIEADEAKVSRMQVEIKQVRSATDRRVLEKEEECDNARKEIQQSLETLQTNTESERREKTELQKTCTKLLQDVNELRLALDHANEANDDAQNNIKRYAKQIAELQNEIVEVQQRRDNERESFVMVEKKLTAALSQRDEFVNKLQQVEQLRQKHDIQINDLKIKTQQMESQNVEINAEKKKLANQLMHLNNEMVEREKELAMTSESLKTASLDTSLFSEQLHEAQQQSQDVERANKKLDLEIKQVQNRIDNFESAARRGSVQNAPEIVKLEEQLKTFSAELESEQRRSHDAHKDLGKQERRTTEIQFQLGESEKRAAQMRDLVDKLQAKIKKQKKLIDEQEEQAGVTLRKYKQLQFALENAEQRAKASEDGTRTPRTWRSAPSQGGGDILLNTIRH